MGVYSSKIIISEGVSTVATENGGSTENAPVDGTDKKTEVDSGKQSQQNDDSDQNEDIESSDAVQTSRVGDSSAVTNNVTDSSGSSLGTVTSPQNSV